MRKQTLLILILITGFCFIGNVFSGEKEDCVALSEQAAKMMKADRDSALAEINKKDGQFVKGKIYVFAMKKSVMVGHAMNPNLLGKDLIDLKDTNGKEHVKEMLEVVKTKGAGWVDYMWPKPGETEPSAKTSYVLKVDDEYFVGAGYYK